MISMILGKNFYYDVYRINAHYYGLTYFGIVQAPVIVTRPAQVSAEGSPSRAIGF